MHRAKTIDGVMPDIVLGLTRRIHGHVAHARARKSLAALDDHLLRDLGISRADIDYAIKDDRRP
jgi:uncharacterized protein YjiS (DUF1127 family)